MEVGVARLPPDDPRVGSTRQVLALAYLEGGKPALALESAQQALDAAMRVSRGQARHPLVINTRSTYSRALAVNGRLDEAVVQLQRAIDDAKILFGADNRMVGYFVQNLVKLQLDLGRIKDALRSAQEAVGILSKHVQRNSFTVGAAINGRARASLAARASSDAYADYTTALQIGADVLGAAHPRIVETRIRRAQALAQAGRFSEARNELAAVRALKASPSIDALRLHVEGFIDRLTGQPATALRLQREASSHLTGNALERRSLAFAEVEIGLNELELGRFSDAIASLEAARNELVPMKLDATPEHADALSGLGRAKLAVGDAAGAVRLLEQANDFWQDFDADNRWAGEAALWLGRAYLALGQRAEGEHALARAERLLSQSPISSDARLLELSRQR